MIKSHVHVFKICRETLIFQNFRGGVKVVKHGFNNQIVIRKGCYFRDVTIIFYGNNNIVTIGNNCKLRGCTISLFDNGNTISIGDNNDWGQGINIIAEEGTNILIGDECQFGDKVAIRSSDGHSIISNTDDFRINKALDITIGERCWLGENVYVLKGAVIKPDCIIGACSVVPRGIYESNSVFVGCPVRQIKRNVHWIAQRI